MPSIDDYKQYLIRTDYGLVFLVAATAICVMITIVLWRRWPRFFAFRPSIAAAAIVFVTTFTSPWVGFIAAFGYLGLEIPVKRIRLTPHLILLIALTLRLPLMFMSFWYDEAFTARLATLPLSGLSPAIQADVHPPLYYTVIWIWSHLAGHTEFMLRLPSLAFGLLSIYLLYKLVIALGLAERVALIAALLCAITPGAIYYSTELRSYSMMVCAVFGALICILQDRPRGFIISVALIAWLHNLGLLYVPVLAAAGLLYHLRNQFVSLDWDSDLLYTLPALFKWGPAALLAGLAAAIWLPLALAQSHAISDGFWISFDAGTPLWTLTLNLMYLPREMILPLMLPYIALTFLSLWLSRAWLRNRRGQLALILIVAVPALAVLISLLWVPVYLPRVFLPVTLIGLIPLGYGLERHRRVVGAVAIPVLITSLLVFFSTVHLIRPDYRSMVAQGCAGATAMYYTAIDTAITIAPDTGLPSLVWPGSSDRGGTFKPGELPLFGFQPGDLSQFAGQKVCLAYIFTPRTLQSERDRVAQLLASYPHSTREYDIHPELQVDVYQLEVKAS
jgi:hypothetical protein